MNIDKDKALEQINATNKNTMMELLGIEYTEFTGDSITGSMEVDSRVHQPYGLLHGGATAVLAETLGSVLSALQFKDSQHGAVGTNLNIYHLKSVRKGMIFGTARFIRKGSSLHVIEIKVIDEVGDLISTAILTTKIIVKSRKIKKE